MYIVPRDVNCTALDRVYTTKILWLSSQIRLVHPVAIKTNVVWGVWNSYIMRKPESVKYSCLTGYTQLRFLGYIYILGWFTL